MIKNLIAVCSVALLLTSCGQNGTVNSSNTSTATTKTNTAPANNPQQPSVTAIKTTYSALSMKDSGKAKLKGYSEQQLQLLYALNRVDSAHIRNVDTVIVPAQFAGDIMQYSPFPYDMPQLRDVKKIIFFSYYDEAFGAYENGRLIRWGPTNMGRKTDPTPTGLFSANWKAEVTHSTVKDEWVLKWNVNIQNKEGVGWHEYDLPGYPASHSCLRLLEVDAKYLYDWADQWVQKGADSVAAYGTPTVVFGEYPFGGRKPWLNMLQNPDALTFSEDALNKIVTPYLDEIKKEQQTRANISTDQNKPTSKK